MKIKEGVCIDINDLYSEEQVERLYEYGALVGIDQATNSGLAFLERGKIKTYRVSMSASKPFAEELSQLVAFIFAEPIPTFVAHEVPTGRYYNAIVKSSKILGAIEYTAYRNKIGTIGYTATDIKKMATGKGNSNKEAMLMAARQFAEFDNDDEADAFFILKRLIDDLLTQN